MRKTIQVATVLVLVLSVVAAVPATAKKKGCAKYKPGDQGAGAELVKVTDKASEDAPVEVTVEVPEGTPAEGGHGFYNVQVDSKAKSTGLFVRWEFPQYEDNDLYVNLPDGTTVAQAAGFNPTPFGPFDGTGSGGHSEMGAEQVDGVATKDCQGYTLDLATYLSPGGEFTVLLWLGEPAG